MQTSRRFSFFVKCRSRIYYVASHYRRTSTLCVIPTLLVSGKIHNLLLNRDLYIYFSAGQL